MEGKKQPLTLQLSILTGLVCIQVPGVLPVASYSVGTCSSY